MYEQYKGKIIAALVLGIVSVVLIWFGLELHYFSGVRHCRPGAVGSNQKGI